MSKMSWLPLDTGAPSGHSWRAVPGLEVAPLDLCAVCPDTAGVGKLSDRRRALRAS
jgi:hypothetical protein